METDEAKAIYKERAATAECVNTRARALGLHQLTVRGTEKVLSVLLLVGTAHNLLRWIALTTLLCAHRAGLTQRRPAKP